MGMPQRLLYNEVTVMNGINKIINYIDSITPKNIPEKKRRKIYDEMFCHILDRMDYYEEIGYSGEQSADKAIEDMGTDEETKKYLHDEFEELYHERTWWAFIPSAIILLMNFLCYPLDVWVTSADYNDEPNGWKILVSFAMLFVCFAFIRFAEIKRLRKMLVGIGISNLIIAVSLLFCFYPQAALYAVEQNFYLMLDKCTPFTLNPEYFWFYYYAAIALLIVIFLYCIIQSVRIKRGTAGKKTKKGTFIIAVCCVLFAGINTALYPVSERFCENYPLFFDWLTYSTEESKALFDEIQIGASFEAVDSYLNGKGWVTFSDYETRLDKNTAKKFRFMRKDRANFDPDYTVWFNPELNIGGNGFVFVKIDDNGCVTEKGVGNPNSFSPVKDYDFRCYNRDDYIYDSIEKLDEDWEKMKIGDSREEIMSVFGTEYGTVYSQLQSETGESFAIYVYGSASSTKDASRYIIISFTDGKLTRGDMYWQEYNGKEYELNKYSIK